MRRLYIDIYTGIAAGSLFATLFGGVPADWTVPFLALMFCALLFSGNGRDLPE